MRPQVRYAKAGDVSIAYATVGEGPVDIVINFGFVSHIDLIWDGAGPFFERLATFSRVVLFDKRGVGLSDPVDEVPSFEERMQDLTAVIDAVGAQRPVLCGVSEGAAMTSVFAATYPERVHGLILLGPVARATWAPDFPWPSPKEALLASSEATSAAWGQGASIEIFAPSMQDVPEAREMLGRFERMAASPKMLEALFEMFLEIDVREVLPSIQVPTLIMHRRGDRVVNIRAARWIAGQIPGARLVELDGIDHSPWVGDPSLICDEIQAFVTGTRPVQDPERVLATVMFTDMVGSTERAAALGDAAWRAELGSIDALTRETVARYGGTVVKTLGDGTLATFDGPGRAIRCAWSLIKASEAAGTPLRVGIHTGEVERIGADIGGIGVHIASRIGALAATGEILVSRTVCDLVVGSGIRFEPRGRHVLKGIPNDWDLFAADPT